MTIVLIVNIPEQNKNKWKINFTSSNTSKLVPFVRVESALLCALVAEISLLLLLFVTNWCAVGVVAYLCSESTAQVLSISQLSAEEKFIFLVIRPRVHPHMLHLSRSAVCVSNEHASLADLRQRCWLLNAMQWFVAKCNQRKEHIVQNKGREKASDAEHWKENNEKQNKKSRKKSLIEWVTEINRWKFNFCDIWCTCSCARNAQVNFTIKKSAETRTKTKDDIKSGTQWCFRHQQKVLSDNKKKEWKRNTVSVKEP